ncbi:hypothetical protein HK103_004814 [Boothiomyces macroporosus]|uniref:Heat shock protein 70 n=1 Tax=Boothiomyces macroporosus TaxID=261099 RepID=A0AAD5UKI6_9FUNG|nr:hypothetical protein HK103_004814 [Boothiomyces macroporosus]
MRDKWKKKRQRRLKRKRRKMRARSKGMRFPHDTFGGLKSLMGKLYNDQGPNDYRKIFDNIMVESDRGTVAFKQGDETLQVEQLVAYLFAHAKRQAEKYAEITVSGAVITVPPNFNHFERQAILDAAQIANLKVFSLINDETAVAINFAVGKKFEKKEHHIFYDMGAGTTIATVVSFHSGSDKYSKNLVDMEIKGHAVDSSLGGLQVDLRIQNYLANEFKKLHGDKLSGDVFANPRALAKLLKEANRVKTILSANQNVMASIEGLMDEIDFKMSVTRKKLEELCADLFDRATGPLEKVLKDSQITLDDVKSLVLFGGGVRVPAVQKKLLEYVGEGKIARNVDGDEAAVMGAVLHAAAVSAQFKLGLTTRIKDINLTPIQIGYETEPNGRYHNTVLFTNKTVLGSKKLMSFKRVSDFDFNIDYINNKVKTPIATVKVTGLSAAIEKYKDQTSEEPKVKVQIELTEAGIVNVKDATAFFDIKQVQATQKPDSIKDTVLNFFGGKKEGEKEENAEETSSESATSTSTEKPKPTEKASDSKKVVVEKVPLKFEIKWHTVAPLSSDEITAFKNKQFELDVADDQKLQREEALNNLEAYIYKCKELSWDDDFEDIATSEEQELLKETASTSSEWLEDNSENAKYDEFVEKKKELVKVAKPIFKRRSEHSQRPNLLASFKAELEAAQSIQNVVEEKLENTTITPEELEKFKAALAAESKWIQEQEAAQALLKNNQDPVLTIQSLKEHGLSLRRLVSTMDPAKRLKPKPKVKKNDTETKEEQSDDSKAKDFEEMLTKMMEKSDFKLDKKLSEMSPEELDALMASIKSEPPKEESSEPNPEQDEKEEL